MAEMLELMLRTILTAFAGAFAGAVIVWAKGLHKRDSAVKAVVHDSFHRQCREILAQDSMTEDDLENLNYLHDAYKSLGLNGTGEELYKRCLEKRIE